MGLRNDIGEKDWERCIALFSGGGVYLILRRSVVCGNVTILSDIFLVILSSQV